jgi:hypothetical protein
MKYTIGYLLFFCFVILMMSCGRVGVSDSKHEVGGEATVRVVIGIDVTACEGLEPEAKAECIQSLIELAKLLSEQDDFETTGGIR